MWNLYVVADSKGWCIDQVLELPVDEYQHWLAFINKRNEARK